MSFGIISTTMMKTRTVIKKSKGKLFDWSVLKIKGYPFYLCFAFVQIFAFITPLFNIPSESMRPSPVIRIVLMPHARLLRCHRDPVHSGIRRLGSYIRLGRGRQNSLWPDSRYDWADQRHYFIRLHLRSHVSGGLVTR
jgi:hypothetical protein